MTRRIGLVGTAFNPLDRNRPAAELAAMLPAGVELVGYPSHVPAFPHSALEQVLQQIGHLHAAMRAADDGCAALVIDSLGDYGLAAMRAGVGVPTFGSGEAGVAEAMAGGRRFAVVNVGAEADTDNLGGPDGYLAQVRGGAPALLDRIVAACEDAARGGAEAILLGCTCMSPLAATLAERVFLPVVNPLAAGLRAALAAPDVPVPERAHPLRDRRALVDAMVAAVADQPAEDCPVCVVASHFEQEQP
ncbi:aspartate/glutamate racemase family protein [Croceicoccus sp. BE223]|uniref:aspartate/glutamate racemase family protein n=1 Tax=Croceicoccus sp. BE223 TaxID=2817716 RepID=UPI0028555A08|nr:aspartate/glutamate racemase family protein [Croceicoccus sp. BE223]MDR7101167.1 allantoin racemase [Croceicoccus sp. BE223]